MKVTLTRDVFVAGKPGAAGETVDVSDRDGRYLIAIGKATAVVVKVEPEKAVEEVISKAVPGGKRPPRKK